MDRDGAKQAAGEAAAALVQDGMRLGLGTGSTTAFALEALGRRIKEEKLDVVGVPTSFESERRAREHGIPLTTLDDTPDLDLAIDGADEVDSSLRLIKGGGGAHTREKVVATQAERFVVVVDPSKNVDLIGEKAPVPVEVVPMAVRPVRTALEELGATPTLRGGVEKSGPIVSDQGLWILDAQFPDGISNPSEVNRRLCDQPGILDHGLFLNLATDVIVGYDDGTTDHRSTGG